MACAAHRRPATATRPGYDDRMSALAPWLAAARRFAFVWGCFGVGVGRAQEGTGPGAAGPDVAGVTAAPAPERLPVRGSPYLTVATTTRNLTFGGRLAVGRPLGPGFTVSLGADWLLSGLVAGFLLDDLGSPRFTSAQIGTWTFPWPHAPAGEAQRWLPRLQLGLGVWETAEVDSLLQVARTEDYGFFLAESVGGQAALLFPYVSVAFGLRPFGSTTYLRGHDTYSTEFQFVNALLDVDVTLDLAQLWDAGRPAGKAR